LATRRTKRVGALIQSEIAALLMRRVKEPRLKDVTITGVDVSPDLRQAKIFFSLLDAAKIPDAIAGFEAAAPFLRRELAARLQTKVTPRLVPVYDGSMARGADMNEIIRKVREEDQALAVERGEEENS
jgi:ribosome-binding factor A